MHTVDGDETVAGQARPLVLGLLDDDELRESFGVIGVAVKFVVVAARCTTG